MSASLLLVDEQYTRRQARPVRKQLHAAGFRVRRHGEYLVAARRGVVEHRKGRRVRATRVYSLLSSWRDAWLGLFLLEHVASGVLLRAIVAHLAAGVQDGDGYRRRGADDKVEANRGGLRAIGRRIFRERRRHPEWLHFWCGDLNMGVERIPVQDGVEHLTGTRLMWNGVPRPLPGTHDARGVPRRTIDAIGVARNVGLELKHPRRVSVEPPRGVDHWAVAAVLVFEAGGVEHRVPVIYASGRYDANPKTFAAYLVALAA